MNVKVCLAIFACVLAVLGGRITMAAEGRIPIHQQTVITESGSYLVTQDITCTTTTCNCTGTNPAVILIDADHVTINLGGHTITSLDPNCNIIANTNARRDIHIHNGKLVGGNYHVLMEFLVVGSGGEYILEDLVAVSDGVGGKGIALRGSGTSTPPRVVVQNVKVIDSLEHGIWIEFIGNGQVRGNTIAGPASNGILCYECKNTSFTENTITGAGWDGLNISFGSRNLVKNNIISNNIRYGIDLSFAEATIIEGNSVTGNSSDGIYADNSSHLTLHRNDVSRSGGAGIYMIGTRYCSITNNTAGGNTSSGIVIATPISEYNVIDGNSLGGNGTGGTGWGLDIQTANNEYSNNRTLGNTTGGINAVPGNVDGGGNTNVP